MTEGMQVTTPMQMMRALWRVLLTSGLMFGFVLLFIVGLDLGFEAVWTAIIVGTGVLGHTARTRLENRTLSPQEVATEAGVVNLWRTRFFVGFAVIEAPLIVGFVIAIARNELWPYTAALPLYLFGMWAIRPDSSAIIDKLQQKITGQGSTVLLQDVLNRPAQAIDAPPG